MISMQLARYEHYMVYISFTYYVPTIMMMTRFHTKELCLP